MSECKLADAAFLFFESVMPQQIYPKRIREGYKVSLKGREIEYVGRSSISTQKGTLYIHWLIWKPSWDNNELPFTELVEVQHE